MIFSFNKLKKCIIVQAMVIIISLALFPESPALSFEGRLNIEYATGFTVEEKGTCKLLRNLDPYPGATEPVEYLLVPRGEEVPPHAGDARVVEVPIRSCVSTTTVNLAFLRELGVARTLVGQGGKRYVYGPDEFEKSLPETGEGMNLDLEKILDLAPDAMFVYSFSPSERDGLARLQMLGVNVVYCSEYLENTPLGRAEWIKYIALFFCLEDEAERIFGEISKNYERLASRVEGIEPKPAVLTNHGLSGTWYVPAGANWVSRLLKDAGARYPWSDTNGRGSLALDFEEVYEKASGADFWINTGSWNYLEDVRKEDDRYTGFRPYAEKQIYNNNARLNSYGGNDYHQSAVLRADLVLADLVSIFHPDILPGHSLLYYKKLGWMNER